MEISVAHTPGEALDYQVAIVVVDVIRATTTALTALAQGYREVICCADIETARATAAELGPGAMLAGERNCVRIEGFHFGNSPREFSEGQPLGDTLVLTTTNGTRAVLQALEESDEVLIGALANLAATSTYLAKAARAGKAPVGVRCAGVRGAIALDDSYVAGRIVNELAVYLPEWSLADGAALAKACVAPYASALQALGLSQSARDLEAAELTGDVRVCAQADTLDFVAIAEPHGEGRARVRPLPAGVSR